mmetsp:Transcript_13848/g.18495  ORF Transcript_13848/g.18495 Transcript_13848/m.18495 type:complete len:253 (+) Transcript_13848:18-776(+)
MIAVVTGANKGIGYHIAEQLLPSVTLLILACRDLGRGAAAAKMMMTTKSEYADKLRVMQLDISDSTSIDTFVASVGEIDVLVNNAGIAYKNADPTPFKEQCLPTLKTNFWGTIELTEKLKPKKVVNVASRAGKLSQLSPERQKQFSSDLKSKDQLFQLVREFESDVAEGNHAQNGWGNSNYGFSKLGLIAYTKLLSRDIQANCCCPGYCDTDMTSHKGPRSPAQGARNAVMLALPSCSLNGVFISDEQVSEW